MEPTLTYPPTLIAALHTLVHLLAAKDYVALEAKGFIATLDDGGHVTGEEIEEILANYGDDIASKRGPSAEEIRKIEEEVGPYSFPTGTATLIDVPLDAFRQAWTVEHGGDTTHLVPIDLVAAVATQRPVPARTWMIAFDLWTAEEGRGELNLHVLVTPDPARPAQIAYLQRLPLLLIPPLQDLIRYLVVGDFAGLIENGLSVYPQVTPEEIEDAIIGYRDWVMENLEVVEANLATPLSLPHLIPLPVEGFRFAQAYPASGDVTWWAVDVGLWWSEEVEGFPGDLTLQAEVEPSATGLVARLSDIHVL